MGKTITRSETMEYVKNAFLKEYGGGDEGLRYFFSPGRVNIIGEHIDYNGGYVFPCALDFGTYAVVRQTEQGGQVSLASLNMEDKGSFDLSNLVYQEKDDWMNYPKGVLSLYQEQVGKAKGFQVMFFGDIPNGSGLSSSASLEVLTAVIADTISNRSTSMIEMVKLSQKAENSFMGVNCGIMDQFAVGMGEKDKAMLLDCDSLKFEYVPFVLSGVKVVIGNTKKRRGLADSKYNERRSQCEEGLSILQKSLDIENLCELDIKTFEEHKDEIKDEVISHRVEHAVYENARVLSTVEALKKGDLVKVGQFLNESHRSLRDLYEVTGFELDTMVEEAWKIPGTLGARMTGAGFGGCIVALVKDEAVDTFIEEVGSAYEGKTGLKPEFYVANVGQGTHEVKGE